MSIGINAATADFRERLVALINQSRLPCCVVRGELTEVRNTVRTEEVRQIAAERETAQQEEEKETQGEEG